MAKTILVTGREGYLSGEIAQHFLNLGCRVAVSASRRTEGPAPSEKERKLLQISWNRASAASCKNLLFKIDQDFTALDEVWIVVSPEREALSLSDLTASAIDETLDVQIKGLLYLVRELVQRQLSSPRLALHFVFYDEDPASLPPLAALHYHGMKASVRGLMTQARKRSVGIWAYESHTPKPDEFLSSILAADQFPPGVWHALGEKKSRSWFGKKEP